MVTTPTPTALAPGAYRCFTVLAVAYIASQFYRVSNAVIAPELMSELTITPEAMGAITGAFFLAFGLMQIPTGILLDRFGPRLTMATLLVAAVAGSAIFTLGSSAEALLTGRSLIGVGCAAGLMGAMVAIARWFPPERFASMSSWLFIIGGIGTVLATTPLAALSDAVGWRGAFGLMTAVTAVMAVLLFTLVRDHPSGQVVASKSETIADIAAGMREVIKNRNLWHVSALQFVNYASMLTISGLWAGPYLHDVYGLTAVDRGNVLLTINVATLAGVLAYSVVEKRVGSRRRTIIGGCLLSTSLLAILALFPAAPVAVTVALLVGFAFSNAFVMLLHAHARAVLPDRLVGRGLTLENLAVFLGIAVLQAASGVIVGSFEANAGSYPVEAYQTVFWFLVAAAALALAAYWPIDDASPAAAR